MWLCCSPQVPAAVVSAVTWLGYVNSSINPCVYAWLNRDFRAAFRRILLCGNKSRGGGASGGTETDYIAGRRGSKTAVSRGGLAGGADNIGKTHQVFVYFELVF